MSLHHYYDQLTDDEREAVDEAYSELAEDLAECGAPIAGDDRAERVVDAIARGVIESRGIASRKSSGLDISNALLDAIDDPY